MNLHAYTDAYPESKSIVLDFGERNIGPLVYEQMANIIRKFYIYGNILQDNTKISQGVVILFVTNLNDQA